MFSFKADRAFEYSEGILEVICPASRIYSALRTWSCIYGQDDRSATVDGKVALLPGRSESHVSKQASVIPIP